MRIRKGSRYCWLLQEGRSQHREQPCIECALGSTAVQDLSSAEIWTIQAFAVLQSQQGVRPGLGFQQALVVLAMDKQVC